MRTFYETVAALGAPVTTSVLDDWNKSKLVVARWVRRDAYVVRSRADALRVAVNLGCASNLDYKQKDVAISISRTAGDIGIVPPGPASKSIVAGAIDVMEIFVDAESLAGFGIERIAAKPTFEEIADDDLKASAVSLFLASRDKLDAKLMSASSAFRQSLMSFIETSIARGASSQKGGLSPRTLQKINDFLEAWFCGPDHLHPSVHRLAQVARLSPHHFIRAFRETTGTTPYQYVMLRRRRHAMALLRCQNISIAEVSDRLKFSSPSHFIASFRRRFGASPGEYRDAIFDPEILGPGQIP